MPFHVRRSSLIQQELGMQKSAPDGFIEQPIYSTILSEKDQSGLEEASCSEAVEASQQTEANLDTAYQGHKDILEKMRQPI